MSNLVGKTLLNRYNVQEFLGRGGMAEVYKVWDSERAVHLAMKVIHADLAEDKIFLRRFKREANNLAQLQHPHIVRFYGLEQDQYLVFMLMDFVEGKSLKTRIFRKENAFTPEEARQILKPLTAALHFAHNRGLVHCDIKPANIMLDKHDEVRLADFGIARMSDAATATMVGAGTPAYMSPEQIRGEDPTPQSDIYALGIVLYEMLTGGERPFTGEQATITGSTGEKVRWEQMNLLPLSPRLYNPDISHELEAVILKCLEKDPAKRYQSALDFFNAFELAISKRSEAKAESPQPAPAMEAPSAPQQPNKKTAQLPKNQTTQPRKWLPAAGIALIAFLFLGFGWLMGGGATKVFPTKTPTRTFTPVHTATPTITPTPVLGIGSTMISEKDGMVMVYVPEGEFQMGSEDGDSDEEPIHSVYLDAYWIDQTEITNAMFAEFLNAEGNQSEGGVTWLDAGNSDVLIVKNGSEWQPKSGYEDHPVIEVSWYGAQAYCDWAGKHLPTEAEWEKAARGNLTDKKYPWGDADPTCSAGAENGAQYNGCSGQTTAVKSFAPNGYGLYDMAGNVWEWTADWYDSSYYQNSPRQNPLGPNTGAYRVLRGGSWVSDDDVLRAAVRNLWYPDSTYYNVGFRCSLSLP